MSFGFSKIRMDTVGQIAEKEVAVKTSVSEMESGGAVKVLDVVADGKLMSLDASGDNVRVFGRVNFKLLYTDRDSEIRGLDYFADFNESISVEGLTGKIYGRITVIDVDTSIGGGIKLSAVAEIKLFSVAEKEVECLTAADEEYYTEKDVIKCNRFKTSFVTSFSVTDDFDTETDVMKIVLTDATSYVDNVTVGNGNVLVTGGVNGVVTYLADDTVKTANFILPFSEEFDNADLAIGQMLSSETEVKSVRVLLTGVEGSNIIRLETEVSVTVKAYERADEEVIGDIFSVSDELIETREKTLDDVFCGFDYYSDTITGTARIDGDLQAATEVMGVVSCKNPVAKAAAEDGKILIEGVFTANVLYRDETGVSGIELEVPYSLPFMCEKAKEGMTVTAVGAVVNATAKLKRDREIDVSATLGFQVETYGKNECEYISKIETGAKKEVNKSAVSVYIAEEGENLWDVAKALSARPDDIKKQNPDLIEPMKEGDKVFFFRRISFEF